MKHFFKTQLYFNRRERNGIVVLIVLMIAVNLVLALRKTNQQSTEIDNSDFLVWIQQMEDSIKEVNRRQDRVVPVLFRFDPNQVSEEQLVRLGAPQRLASTIVRYRLKGGLFKQPEDLKKIYGMPQELLSSWMPYVDIPKKENTTNRQEVLEYQQKKPKDVFIDLNTADTTQLKLVAGIGSYFANKIVAYRTELGGFHSYNQLTEIFLIDSVKVKSWKNQLKLDTKEIVKLKINEASVNDLSSHPYINYRTANAIVSYRTQHGYYAELREIQKSHLIDESIFRKIAPYLSAK